MHMCIMCFSLYFRQLTSLIRSDAFLWYRIDYISTDPISKLVCTNALEGRLKEHKTKYSTETAGEISVFIKFEPFYL